MRRSVDLPQPDGPTSTRNSPSAISSETSSTADDAAECLRHVLERDRRHRGSGWYRPAQRGRQGFLESGIDQIGSQFVDCRREWRGTEARSRGGARRRRVRRGRRRGRGRPRSRAAASPARTGRGLAVPGFVDLQVNGFGGVDFLDADADGYRRAGEALLETGVTAYLPTLITSPEEQLLAALARGAGRRARDPRILGVHLEGPFLSPRRLGTHVASARRDPDLALLDRLLDGGPVRLMTLAPELPGRRRADRPAARARRRPSRSATATRPPSRRTPRSTSACAPSRTSSTRCARSCTAIPGIVGAALARDDVVVAAHPRRRPPRARDGDASSGAPRAGASRSSPTRSPRAGASDGDVLVRQPRRAGARGDGARARRRARRQRADDDRGGAEPARARRAARRTRSAPRRRARRACSALAELGRLDVGLPADLVVLDDSVEIERVLVAGDVRACRLAPGARTPAADKVPEVQSGRRMQARGHASRPDRRSRSRIERSPSVSSPGVR